MDEARPAVPEGSKRITLRSNEVHIWMEMLDRPADEVAALMPLLSEDERERAERFLRDLDRIHFVVARAGLRTTLASSLGMPPPALRFSYGSRGKPSLPSTGLRFNMSHSGGLACYAIARDREVGIDIEQVRPLHDLEQLAAICFTPGERAILHALPSSEQLDTFYTFWTRKEAYVKAVGVGLSFPLTHVDVSFVVDPGVVVHRQPEAGENWSLRDLTAPQGFRAAIAVEGRGCDIVPHSSWDIQPTPCPRKT